MNVKFYAPGCNGKPEIIDFDRISQDDTNWFEANGVELSVEPMPHANLTALFASKPEDDEYEAVSLVDIDKISCEEAFRALRLKIQAHYS